MELKWDECARCLANCRSRPVSLRQSGVEVDEQSGCSRRESGKGQERQLASRLVEGPSPEGWIETLTGGLIPGGGNFSTSEAHAGVRSRSLGLRWDVVT